MRTIANYMTKQPWSVQIDDSLAVARQMLAAREIRHLPVLDGGRLVGMVTAGDLDAARDREATVEHAMRLAQEVDANTPFADALELMGERRQDAIVIMRDGLVEGIFTAMDAVRVLRERMKARLPRAERSAAPGRSSRS